ncbi:cytidylyltransferase domain-containing protein, partial [Hallella bergensis]|uniref:cytidylyltransferase domain-containing protein n=1 Tax=Hallella bergensis TaxID=242750 RepID=UPI0039906579
MKKIAIIPARYSSTRFPGKPLALLAAKPVIQRVYEKVSQIISETWVATDDERIFNKVKEFGGNAVMTRANHQSGTDRIQEAVSHIKTDAEIIINIQGDEPFVQHSQINTLCKL